MPQDYKCNIFFTSPAITTGQIPNGWSETYYTSQDSLDGAADEAKFLAIGRAGLLATPCEIIALRISELTGNRISRLLPPEDYSYFPNTNKADTAWQAALVRLNTDEGLSRALMMRGIPDAIYNPESPAEVAARAAWLALLQTYIDARLVTGPWSIYGISKNLISFPKLPIVDITNATPGELRVTVTTTTALSAGDLVHLYFSGITPPLGTVKVQTTPAANVFTIKGDLPPGWELPVAAYARKISKSLWKITSGNFERVTHRIVGRPFGLQRGRRKACPPLPR